MSCTLLVRHRFILDFGLARYGLAIVFHSLYISPLSLSLSCYVRSLLCCADYKSKSPAHLRAFRPRNPDRPTKHCTFTSCSSFFLRKPPHVPKGKPPTPLNYGCRHLQSSTSQSLHGMWQALEPLPGLKLEGCFWGWGLGPQACQALVEWFRAERFQDMS